MSIAKLNPCVPTIVRCLVENKTRRGHLQEEYADAYGRIEEAATKKLNGHVLEFVKQWAWEEITVEEDSLCSEEKREAMMEISRTATDV